ncbi:MAG TPA: flagellar motor protein MotB [Acetobacteraceae bacterium]|nr:flagellar motor protein MotB [Acetobacteraceae bacterium]
MAGKGGKANGRNAGVTIIRREEVVEGGHHGGAWKVAYADFVTAMMAFFLLMWLLNATTEDQRKGLADYFSPNNLMSHASSGVGQPFGGHTVFDHGAMVSDRGAAQVLVGMRPVVQDPPDQDSDTPLTDDAHGAAAQPGPAGKTDAATPGSAEAKSAAAEAGATTTGPDPGASGAAASPGGAVNVGVTSAGVTSLVAAGSGAGSLAAAKAVPVVARTETLPGSRAPTDADIRAAQTAREKLAFEQAAEQIRQAVRGDPALEELSRQLTIDITPEGLRIQLLDADRLPMFATGSAALNDRAGLLLAKVAPVLMRLPEAIAVVGHTDAAPYAGTGKTNWELSTERANATRRLLTDKGLAESRVSRVTGLADRDPLVPADPLAAANRRIAIIVLRGTEKPVEPAATKTALPSIAGPAPSPAPSSAAASAPPSITAPAGSSAGSPAPSPASITATLSDPSSNPASDLPAEPTPLDQAPEPGLAPSFVPSFAPSFAVPSRSPSVAAPMPPGQPGPPGPPP